MVNCDSNRFGKSDSKANSFDLLKGKTFSQSGSMTVSDSLASNSRSKSVEWARTNGGCFGSSGLKSSVFSAGLIEPYSDVSLPVLSEVDVGDDVVVLNHANNQYIKYFNIFHVLKKGKNIKGSFKAYRVCGQFLEDFYSFHIIRT